MMRTTIVAVLLATSGIAYAQPAATTDGGTSRANAADAAASSPRPSSSLVYVEALGKAGPYGLGYEHAITRRLALGAVWSYASLRGHQLYTVASYVHVTALARGRHALFGELGAAFVLSRVPSPVPEWDGMSDSGLGGQATVGWEWRPAPIVVRTYLGGAVGEGGAAPFGGLLLGVAL